MVVDPVLAKKRDARRESFHAYLKSASDYNRAEMKLVSDEAHLQLAEFWLDVVTKNVEDVGSRINLYDWNVKLARENGELE